MSWQGIVLLSWMGGMSLLSIFGFTLNYERDQHRLRVALWILFIAWLAAAWATTEGFFGAP